MSYLTNTLVVAQAEHPHRVGVMGIAPISHPSMSFLLLNYTPNETFAISFIEKVAT